MLELAFLNKEALSKQFIKIHSDIRYMYYFTSTFLEYEVEIDSSSWSKIQQVSKNKDGEIIGYFSVNINRESNNVSNVRMINFQDKPSITFSKDMHTFLSSLFDIFSFNKINWCVTIGNPAENMYDKIVKNYNGRIVGVYEKEFKFINGKYYDTKVYEILKENYDKRRKLNE